MILEDCEILGRGEIREEGSEGGREKGDSREEEEGGRMERDGLTEVALWMMLSQISFGRAMYFSINLF